MLISFVGLAAGAVLERKSIAQVLGKCGLTRKKLMLALGIAALFVILELAMVKPTQLLFFDDAIYQGMAQSLLHSGQAWMCDYGSPSMCYSGEIYHEPIGLAFNFAMAFAVFGVNLWAAHFTELALAALSVFMCFPVALLLFKDLKTAYFSEFLMALSPVILVWAMPTNSDMALLAYSLFALFFLLIFIGRKSRLALLNVFLSVSLTLYMKVFAVIYIPLFAIMYLVLDDGGIAKSVRNNFRMIAAYAMDTQVLMVLLITIIAVAPALNYVSVEASTGDYGATGTMMQNTCNLNTPSVVTSSNIGLANFRLNVCSNVLFWFDQYVTADVMQPMLFTVLAIVGAVMMIFGKRRELLALGLWFLALFVLYTAFYAGSVVYGVDWRFMLSLIAQVCIFGGFAVSTILSESEEAIKRRISSHSVSPDTERTMLLIAVAVLLVPMYLLAPRLSVSTSKILQAPDARFYEGFIYNESRLIPPGCLVYSYDPTLFNINGRNATQMSDLYNTSRYDQFRSEYPCLVLDYGYWCYTPNNVCSYVEQNFDVNTAAPIAVGNFTQFGRTYGLYYITGKKSQ
jgi:hypothetical protein